MKDDDGILLTTFQMIRNDWAALSKGDVFDLAILTQRQKSRIEYIQRPVKVEAKVIIIVTKFPVQNNMY